MRVLLLALFLFPSLLFAQPEADTTKVLLPTENEALFKLQTVHMDGERPRAGERITFLDKKTKEQLELVTDELGQARVLLPKGHSYGVYNKFLNSSKPISAVDVPDQKGELIFRMKLQWDLSETKFRLDNVQFDSGKATLRSESHETLDELAAYLESHPTMTIEIQGHTDDHGTSDSNLSLSSQRAASVKTYLANHGIADSRMTSKGYGESKPVTTNDTSEGRQKNRRTEVRILTE